MAVTREDLISTIVNSRGNISVIARRLGVSRRHVYNLLGRWTSARTVLEDEREARKDFAESKLDEAVESGNLHAIRFFLSTQARDRGYAHRTEVSGPESTPITVRWEFEVPE